MKHLNKFVLTISLFLPCSIALGQTEQGLPSPAFHWKSPAADSLLNFHPATIAPLHFDSVPYAEDYTVVVVYKPVVDTEARVWQLVFADSINRVLTTERIISDSTAIRYSNHSDSKPVIHTLRQSAPDMSSPHVSLSVGDGNIKVSEVLYYNHRLGNTALRRVQSALAIRYGITLGPVDYIGDNGKRVWQHRRDSAVFHHRITGIGSDTASNLHQLSSRSEMEGSVVTLSADSIPQGAYLLVGDNDSVLVFQQENDDTEKLTRQWCIQATGWEATEFSLAFDMRSIPIITDSIVLLFGDNIVLPSVSTENELCFNNLWLQSDTCIFTLARGTFLWQLAQEGAKGNSDNKGTAYGENKKLSYFDLHTSIYPNPTTGHYNIEVSGARQVQVTIYGLHGNVVAIHNGSDREQYWFEGALPSGNVYYATITTESGSQTMKLVVK